MRNYCFKENKSFLENEMTQSPLVRPSLDGDQGAFPGINGESRLYFFTTSSSPRSWHCCLSHISLVSSPQTCINDACTPRNARVQANPLSSWAIICISSSTATIDTKENQLKDSVFWDECTFIRTREIRHFYSTRSVKSFGFSDMLLASDEVARQCLIYGSPRVYFLS